MSVAGGRFKYSRGDGVGGPRYTKYTPVGAASDLNDEAMGWAPRTRCEFFQDFTGPVPTFELVQPLTLSSSSADINKTPVTNTEVAVTYFTIPRSGVLLSASLVGQDTLAANDTNYLTFTMVNYLGAGAGSTAMLAASDANTTKATGGAAVTALVPRAMTVNATAANLRVNAGDVVGFIATATQTPANAVDAPVVRLVFSTFPYQGSNSLAGLTTRTADSHLINTVANTRHGEAIIQLEAVTSEAGVAALYWGDQVLIPMNARPLFQARLKVNAAVAATRLIWGLSSAYTATLDNIVSNCWFRLEGASLIAYAESDDGTTDTDDTSTTVTLTADTYYLFTIDATDKGAIRFSIDDTCYLETAASAWTSSSLAQPILLCQKDSGTTGTDRSITCDWIRVSYDRSVD